MTRYEEIAYWIYHESNQPIDEIEALLKDIPVERFEKLYSTVYDGTPEQQAVKDIEYIKREISSMDVKQQQSILDYLKSWVV
jgi:hypothetical protein